MIFAELELSFQQFVMSREFPVAILASTVAGFSGGSYSLEILPSGERRVDWTQNFGNLYVSPGKVICIPALSDEDYQDLCMVAGSNDPEELAEALYTGIGDTLSDIEQQIRSYYETEGM